METITLSTPSVHCRSCQLNIEEAVEDLAGIDTVAVDLGTKSVRVVYDAAVADQAAIVAAIEDAGYPVAS